FRVRQILSEDGHRIQGFDEAGWARRYTDVDPEIALASYLALRRWNLALFRGLAPKDLERQAVHPERGPETLGTIIRLLAGHDLNHPAQLERLRRRRPAAAGPTRASAPARGLPRNAIFGLHARR